MLRPARPVSSPYGPCLSLGVTRVQVVVPASRSGGGIAHIVLIHGWWRRLVVMVCSTTAGPGHQVVLLVLAVAAVQMK